MTLAEWLDQKAEEGVDLAGLSLPQEILYDAEADERLYFAEENPCGVFCRENHPYASVERYGHWYHAHGQAREAGVHSDRLTWQLFTKNRSEALQAARSRMADG